MQLKYSVLKPSLETTIEFEEPAIVQSWWYFDKHVTDDISVFKVPKFIPSRLYL